MKYLILIHFYLIISSLSFLQAKDANYDKLKEIEEKLLSNKEIYLELLDVEKEIMHYQLYTQDNIDKVYVPIFNAVAYIDDNDMKHFTNNIDKWNCRGTGNKFKEFKILSYFSKYCEMDCHVSRLGYEIFRNCMLEHTGLDADNYIN